MTSEKGGVNKSIIGWAKTKQIKPALRAFRLIVVAFTITCCFAAYIQRAAAQQPAKAARAVATVTNGSLASIQVTFGGSGYTNPPKVSFLGGGGTNAGALAQIFEGAVTAINIQNPGVGYTNAPLVVVDPP